MKALKLSLCFVVTFLTLQVSTQAQIIDSLPYFKRPLVGLLNAKGVDLKAAYTIVNRSQISAPSAAVTKKLLVPTGVKEVRNPLILKRNGKCYTIKCFPASGCKNCRMFWKDRNGDGKIQPGRELRCGCPDNLNAKCNMDWAETKCN